MISVKTGDVHDFVGKNEAGKYILMKIMTSVYRADEGDSYIENQKIKVDSTKNRRESLEGYSYMKLIIVKYPISHEI